ncbi:MAG: DUF952 domain-containing protein [Parvibaculum sp.]
MADTFIYKIIDRNAWELAQAAGVFKGAAIDLEDGYIHFSTALQARETARLHFKDQTGLCLVAVDAAKLGADLKWEPSRGGQFFPHLYVPLAMTSVARVDDLPLGDDGLHLFPELDAP